ncbi:nuclease [Pueribacillus theae]|uniref:Nuclease n=1 Tax=Pueribacillus theae TaxID=2171751 RepID=A0A2U1K4H0_9BACI|nr:ERCC4 domain-containing protein [Pueribacillus theae]PWA12084.1 nuclease [Pueribacillus theae]
MKELLSSIVILIDTREQQNKHITDYFNRKGISYKTRKLEYGDYAAYIPANEVLNIPRPLYFPAAIERKNSVDELASTIKERIRFENELIRSQRSKFLLLVEEADGYQNIITGQYKSQYNAKALLASLKAFEMRYGFQSVFISPKTSGNYIYHHFYYLIRETLKSGI